MSSIVNRVHTAQIILFCGRFVELSEIMSAPGRGGGGTSIYLLYGYVPLEIKGYGFQAIWVIWSGIGSSNHTHFFFNKNQ